ncbi:MAG: undecaprenyl-diphosphatase UppP [Candidatus Omnitrophota bacterium]|nr:undecaprenyl-diphosphatase UppP [Candidatus Omnitrophota bacterium]
MSVLEAIILGIVQGLTEFLPVSSSGHLVFFQTILGLEEPMLAFDIVMHWGTLFAVFIYFWKDLVQMVVQSFAAIGATVSGKKQGDVFGDYPYALTTALVLLASVPTACIGLAFADSMESFFHRMIVVGIAWIVTGSLFAFSARYAKGNRALAEMNHQDALTLGIAQGIAIVPGVSRSGLTILVGMMSGLDPAAAARFSFLMGIPAILGAGLLKLKDAADFFSNYPAALLAGFVAALLSGYVSISFLLKLIERGKFHIFGYYCLAIGFFSIGYSFLAGA